MLSQTDILDIIIRHQVYVEFFKNDQAEEHSEFLDWIIAFLSLWLTKRGLDSFEDMTKGEITIFIRDFSKRSAQVFGARQSSITAQVRKFFNTDFDMLKSIFGKLTGRKVHAPPASKLWAKLLGNPTPGVGEEPKNLIRTFAKSVTVGIVSTIKQAWAEKWGIAEFLKAIAGTKSNSFRDGLLNRYKNQLSAVIETFISSVSSFLNHSIGSLFFDEYQWVSVLDSHTTEICRGRDGNVYRYGKGPIPPAHYRCRSSIMPIVDYSLKVMPTFSNWVSRQPRPVMDDILGSGLAQRTRTGGATGQDIVNAIRKRKLTLDQFAGKRNLILTSK